MITFPNELPISDGALLSAHIVTEAKAKKAKWNENRKNNALTGEILEQAFDEWAKREIPDRYKENIEEESKEWHYDFKIDGKLIDIKYLISEKYFTISDHCLNHLYKVDYLVFYSPSGDGQSAIFEGIVDIQKNGDEFIESFSESRYDGYYMRVNELRSFMEK